MFKNRNVFQEQYCITSLATREEAQALCLSFPPPTFSRFIFGKPLAQLTSQNCVAYEHNFGPCRYTILQSSWPRSRCGFSLLKKRNKQANKKGRKLPLKIKAKKKKLRQLRYLNILTCWECFHSTASRGHLRNSGGQEWFEHLLGCLLNYWSITSKMWSEKQDL